MRIFQIKVPNKSSIFKNKFALAWLIGNNVKVINHSMGNGDMAFCAAQGNINAMTFQSTTTVEYDKFLCKLIDKGYDFLIVTSAGNSNSTSYYEDLNTTEAPYGYVSVSEYNRNPANYPNADTSTTYELLLLVLLLFLMILMQNMMTHFSIVQIIKLGQE